MGPVLLLILESGVSPAKLLLRKGVRTNIPQVVEQYDEELFRGKEAHLKERQKRNADDRRAKELEVLKPGDLVWIKCSKDKEGESGRVVAGREGAFYDFQVGGRVLRRN